MSCFLAWLGLMCGEAQLLAYIYVLPSLELIEQPFALI
jgi:hypothetical protein